MRIALLILCIVLAGCGTTAPTSKPVSPDAIRAFYVGLAALQVGDDIRAKQELTKATELAPSEPAAWANLGILQIRQKDLDSAGNSLERARSLADKNPRVYETIALLEQQRGNFDAAQANFQKALDLDPDNIRAAYALAKERERAADEAGARGFYEKILEAKPANLEARLEALRLAAKQDDRDAVKIHLARMNSNPDWAPEIRRQFQALHSTAIENDTRGVLTHTSFFRNTLLQDPRFRASVAEVKYSDTTLGEPFTKPLTLAVQSSTPAPADTAMVFERRAGGDINSRWSKFVYLNADGSPVIATSKGQSIQIDNQSLDFAVENPSGLAAVDFDYDFRNDIALAGTTGFRLFQQTDNGFSDVSAQTKIPNEVLNGSYSGVWILDIESDGDLDLILGSKASPPIVLQNNADGTFSKLSLFGEVSGISDFESCDLDEDGDADAAMLDGTGRLYFFANERGGVYSSQKVPAEVRRLNAMTIGDFASDGSLDLIGVQDDGSVIALNRGSADQLSLRPVVQANVGEGAVDVQFHDFDNNGTGDLLITTTVGTVVMLSGGTGEGSAYISTSGTAVSVADINGDGRLDLAGPTIESCAINRGSKNYNWQTVRPRAAKTTGDQRINSFGIGGEIELRSGLSVQKRLITEPVVHFGLGENSSADVLRVVWQNGSVQAEFDLKPNQTVAAEQRLKGSCPHLFAFDGEKFKLVKDAPPWSPALGLKINAQDVFGVLATEEWFKIPGESLKPTKDNFYELRITGEYWESFYLDRYSLLVVDHPETTEVFTDERFSIPPPPLEVFTTGRPAAFIAARNDRGDDVTSIVRDLDEKYLDGFERGSFQGVAKDHLVEIDLPLDAPRDKRIAIVADGWVHPTDASINVQLGQSSKEKPRSLSLEVRDANGEWRIAKENLGFPAGKMKTMLIELPADTRAARLRTNMEVFWDRLGWAVYEDGRSNVTKLVSPAASELRYRGFSVIDKAHDSSPEKPDYDRLLTTTQRWRDLEGFYTRFGDVLELLMRSDDRYVLMNAGDELVLKFPVLAPPPPGYKRDFVLIGDGWIKDGDLNSVFSKTLIPLPTHATNDYSRPPTVLENDPVYQKHRGDWVKFHTRYVSPDGFRNALR
jgi:Tfp pilus assembly protein PilF